MKTVEEINQTLSEFEKKFGLPILGAPQKSELWFKTKLGVPSASNASKIVAKADSDTRASYMASLVAQVCTGIMDELNTKYMDWGNTHEDGARSSYEFQSGYTVTELPFVFKDTSFRVGCSPDGFVTETKGVEIKCPYNSEHHIKTLLADKIKPEYQWQTQFTLWVLDAESWDFVSYDPRMRKKPMAILTVERDEKKMKTFDELVPAFIEDMDKMLAQIGIEFGDQWKV
jgi:putative phage-type endonuclease